MRKMWCDCWAVLLGLVEVSDHQFKVNPGQMGGFFSRDYSTVLMQVWSWQRVGFD